MRSTSTDVNWSTIGTDPSTLYQRHRALLLARLSESSPPTSSYQNEVEDDLIVLAWGRDMEASDEAVWNFHDGDWGWASGSLGELAKVVRSRTTMLQQRFPAPVPASLLLKEQSTPSSLIEGYSERFSLNLAHSSRLCSPRERKGLSATPTRNSTCVSALCSYVVIPDSLIEWSQQVSAQHLLLDVGPCYTCKCMPQPNSTCSRDPVSAKDFFVPGRGFRMISSEHQKISPSFRNASHFLKVQDISMHPPQDLALERYFPDRRQPGHFSCAFLKPLGRIKSVLTQRFSKVFLPISPILFATRANAMSDTGSHHNLLHPSMEAGPGLGPYVQTLQRTQAYLIDVSFSVSATPREMRSSNTPLRRFGLIPSIPQSRRRSQAHYFSLHFSASPLPLYSHRQVEKMLISRTL